MTVQAVMSANRLYPGFK